MVSCFFASKHGPITFCELTEGAVKVSVTDQVKKKDVIQTMQEIGIAGVSDGRYSTVADMKSSIVSHLKVVKEDYERRGFFSDCTNFWSTGDVDVQFESMCVLESGLVYSACTNKQSVHSITISKDGIGLPGEQSALANYEDWGNVSAITVLNNCLYAANPRGIDEVSLCSSQKLRVINNGANYSSLTLCIVSYKGGILYTDPRSHRILHWKKDSNIVTFLPGMATKATKLGR